MNVSHESTGREREKKQHRARHPNAETVGFRILFSPELGLQPIFDNKTAHFLYASCRHSEFSAQKESRVSKMYHNSRSNTSAFCPLGRISDFDSNRLLVVVYESADIPSQ